MTRTLPFDRDHLGSELYELDFHTEYYDDIRTDYRYDGFSDPCVGVVCGPHEVAIVTLAMTATLSQKDKIDVAKAQRIDSMGRALIVYYPGFNLQESIDENDV